MRKGAGDGVEIWGNGRRHKLWERTQEWPAREGRGSRDLFKPASASFPPSLPCLGPVRPSSGGSDFSRSAGARNEGGKTEYKALRPALGAVGCTEAPMYLCTFVLPCRKSGVPAPAHSAPQKNHLGGGPLTSLRYRVGRWGTSKMQLSIVPSASPTPFARPVQPSTRDGM